MRFVRIVLIACALLIAFSLGSPRVTQTATEAPIILGHITDEHITVVGDLFYQRLSALLSSIRALAPDLLISTGDNTDDALEGSMINYRKAFVDAAYNGPFYPIAGNHDAYGVDPYPRIIGPGQYSFTVGNYRFIGFSGRTWELPLSWLEQEMAKSCADGKPIVVFYHFPPSGWVADPSLDFPPEHWRRLDQLLQKYPVIAYLAGHSHTDTLGTFAGYVAHTSGRTAANAYSLYALYDGRINVRPYADTKSGAIIVYPHQYHGLDYTKTRAELLTVKARAVAVEGAIKSVTYSLDGGPAVSMQAVESNMFEAPLDASTLSGQHTINLVVENTLGSWATTSHMINVYFAAEVPPRLDCCSCTPTPTPTSTGMPSATPTPTPATILNCTGGCYASPENCASNCGAPCTQLIGQDAIDMCGWGPVYRCCTSATAVAPQPTATPTATSTTPALATPTATRLATPTATRTPTRAPTATPTTGSVPACTGGCYSSPDNCTRNCGGPCTLLTGQLASDLCGWGPVYRCCTSAATSVPQPTATATPSPTITATLTPVRSPTPTPPATSTCTGGCYSSATNCASNCGGPCTLLTGAEATAICGWSPVYRCCQ